MSVYITKQNMQEINKLSPEKVEELAKHNLRWETRRVDFDTTNRGSGVVPKGATLNPNSYNGHKQFQFSGFPYGVAKAGTSYPTRYHNFQNRTEYLRYRLKQYLKNAKSGAALADQEGKKMVKSKQAAEKKKKEAEEKKQAEVHAKSAVLFKTVDHKVVVEGQGELTEYKSFRSALIYKITAPGWGREGKRIPNTWTFKTPSGRSFTIDAAVLVASLRFIEQQNDTMKQINTLIESLNPPEGLHLDTSALEDRVNEGGLYLNDFYGSGQVRIRPTQVKLPEGDETYRCIVMTYGGSQAQAIFRVKDILALYSELDTSKYEIKEKST